MTTVSGPDGSVRWGYRLVASSGPWTIAGGVLTATGLSLIDPVGLRQSGLSFVVMRPGRPSWNWRLEDVQIADGTLTAAVTQEGG